MIYFIALICFALPSYLIRFSVFGIPTTLLEVLIYVAAIATLILKIKDQKPKTQIPNPDFESRILDAKHRDRPLKPITNNPLLIPIALFILAGIISVIIAPSKREALGLFKAYIFDPILFFWIIIGNIRGNKGVEWIMRGLIAGSVVVAVHAIWQRLTGQSTIDGRVLGVFGYEANASANYLALYLVPITALIFSWEYLILGEKHTLSNYKKIWFYDLALLVVLLALWYTGSRAAIGAVILGAIAFFIFKYWVWIKSRKIITLLLYCFIASLLLISWQMVKPNWRLSPTEGGRITSSNNIRWEIWQTTVRDIIPKGSNWLLGVGLGNYQNYFAELTKNRVNYPEWIAPMALTPHNLFLTVWMNLGLLGLISFVWLLEAFSRYALCVMRYAENNQLITYNLLLITAMVSIIAHGLVDSPYWKNDLAVMFWVFLAIVYFLNRLMQENND